MLQFLEASFMLGTDSSSQRQSVAMLWRVMQSMCADTYVGVTAVVGVKSALRNIPLNNVFGVLPYRESSKGQKHKSTGNHQWI